MTDTYIIENYPHLYQLFEAVRQTEEYTDLPLVARLCELRRQSTDHLDAVRANPSMEEEALLRCISGAMVSYEGYARFAEAVGFIMGYREAMRLTQELGKVGME